MNLNLIYSPQYEPGFLGLERLHPFDTAKYRKVWQALSRRYNLKPLWIEPKAPISDDLLTTVHPPFYLEALHNARYLAQIVEIPLVAYVPVYFLKRYLIAPVLWATQGTYLGSEAVAQHQDDAYIAVNLSGGYHHASANHGEGYSMVSDVAIAVENWRRQGVISSERKAFIIDLDAHQGNGYQRIFKGREDVYMFDMHNRDIYPDDAEASAALHYSVGLKMGCSTENYLKQLQTHLPQAVEKAGNIGAVVYLAGTDIFINDKLGGLLVSEDGVLQRDQYVFDFFLKRNIPMLMVLAGGYSDDSHRLITNAISYLLDKFHTTT
jgi:histone deacetylase 11